MPNKKLQHKPSQPRSRGVEEALRIHKDLILKVLHLNCQGYSWFNQLHGFTRADRWDLLYSWADQSLTVVYESAAEHFAAGQVAALILKYPRDPRDYGFTLSPKETAVAKFWDAEARCKKTNLRFSRYRKSRYNQYIDYARSWISYVLGEFSLEEMYEGCRFSSGASVGVHGNATNLFRKLFNESWSVTPSAIAYAYASFCKNDQIMAALNDGAKSAIVCMDPNRVLRTIEEKARITKCNKVSFVPKTAKTHRAIAVEPLLNSYLQTGADEVLRRKLRAHGYDLSDQTRNQVLARIGSLKGNFGTIDLSSASDTVSATLVRELLPYSWFQYLNQIRCHEFSLDGVQHRSEKFASMGNGFCFPLETLIFAALVRAAIWASGSLNRTHAVYGDDIIVPTESYDLTIRILKYAGFKPNVQKSFGSGRFRESCGADWYEGQDVRPVYLDYHLSDTASLMIFHNATLRGPRQDVFFREIRPWLRSLSKPHEQLLRPVPTRYRKAQSLLELKNLNGAFSVELDEFMGSKGARWNKKEQRWSWQEFVYVPVRDDHRSVEFHLAQYLSFLLGSPGGDLNLRYASRRLRIIR